VNADLKGQDPVVVKVLEAEFKSFASHAAVSCHPPKDAQVILKALEKGHADSAAHLLALIQLKVYAGDMDGAETTLRSMISRGVKLVELEIAEGLERYARLFGIDEIGAFAREEFPLAEFK
jgi:hypothetical protein